MERERSENRALREGKKGNFEVFSQLNSTLAGSKRQRRVSTREKVCDLWVRLESLVNEQF